MVRMASELPTQTPTKEILSNRIAILIQVNFILLLLYLYF